MRKILVSLFLSFSFLSFSEKLSLFESTVSFNNDKSLHIKERIIYDNEGKVTHGINRFLIYKAADFVPLKYNDKIAIKNFKSNFPVSKKSDDGYIRYRIGDPDIYLNEGETEFLIEYDIYNAVRYDDKNTQIYLNATGNYWEMPIDKVVINLDFDKNHFNSLDVYTGAYGQNTGNYKVNGNIIEAEHFGANEGLTFKLNLDRNFYTYTTKDRINDILQTYPIIFNLLVAAFALIIMISSILKYIRNKDNIAIVPEFMIDDSISPAFCSYIYKKALKKHVKYNFLTVLFFNLVTKGLIESEDEVLETSSFKIKGEQEEIKNKWFDIWHRENEKVYSLVDEQKLDEALAKEKYLYDEEKTAIQVFFRNKKNIFASNKNTLYLYNVIEKYFRNKFLIEIGTFRDFNIVFLMIAFFLMLTINIANTDLNTAFLATIVIIIALLFSIQMNVKFSENGKKVIRNIKGFLMYFDVAEKNIFNTLNSQKELIDYCKKMLPYAIALGIEKKFIDKVDEVIKNRLYNRDEIYTGINYGYMYNMMYINNLFTSNIAKASNIKTSSHSSAGGFSSGGGFSGGGFSGGGGSSW